MFKRILVPLDGSTRAEVALPVAARIARASGGTIDLLRVVPPPVDYGMYIAQSEVMINKEIDTAIATATEYLEEIAKSEVLEGIGTKIEALSGAIAQTLLSYAETYKSDLIVMCSHGYSGLKRWMLGSIADKVTRLAPVPVLVLREQGPALIAQGEEGQSICALVTLDGSPVAETVLEPAVQLVAALSAPAHGSLHLMSVVDMPMTEGKWKSQANSGMASIEKAKEDAALYLMGVISTLQRGSGAEAQVKLTASVVTDIDVAGAIIKEAENTENTSAQGTGGYSFIAMSTHGRGGVERWITGSITERTLHSTRLPLLIVRPQQDAKKTHKKAKKDEDVVVERVELQTWSGLL